MTFLLFPCPTRQRSENHWPANTRKRYVGNIHRQRSDTTIERYESTNQINSDVSTKLIKTCHCTRSIGRAIERLKMSRAILHGVLKIVHEAIKAETPNERSSNDDFRAIRLTRRLTKLTAVGVASRGFDLH